MPHIELSEPVCGEGVYTAANACYHDGLTSETTEERVSRLQQMSVHQRDRQTGMSDYRGEESQYSMTVHQTGI